MCARGASILHPRAPRNVQIVGVDITATTLKAHQCVLYVERENLQTQTLRVFVMTVTLELSPIFEDL